MRSNIRGTVGWGKKRLAHFETEKSEVVLLDRSNNSVAIDMWMDGFILEKNDLLRYWSNLSKLNWIRTLILTIAKTVSKKIESLISCLKFLCLEIVLLQRYHTTWYGKLFSCLCWCIKVLYSWNILDKLQKRVCRTVAISLISLMNPCFVVEMYLVEVFL